MRSRIFSPQMRGERASSAPQIRSAGTDMPLSASEKSGYTARDIARKLPDGSPT